MRPQGHQHLIWRQTPVQSSTDGKHEVTSGSVEIAMSKPKRVVRSPDEYEEYCYQVLSTSSCSKTNNSNEDKDLGIYSRTNSGTKEDTASSSVVSHKFAKPVHRKSRSRRKASSPEIEKGDFTEIAAGKIKAESPNSYRMARNNYNVNLNYEFQELTEDIENLVRI